MAFLLRATGRDSRAVDTAEVSRALAVLADPEAGVQLQCSPAWRHRTFAGGDSLAATRWAAQQGEMAAGVYYALNPVPVGLVGKVKVADVLRRRWLLVDVDRAKADENRDQSATDGEKRAAEELATEIADHLTARGWPPPVVIDSGNGRHLLYRIDLPNDDEGRVLCREALHALARRFDGPRGAVGRECHDARRIAKLPGTWARKGVDTSDRPHRMARLVSVPNAVEIVGRELLAALGAKGAPAEGGPPPAPPSRFVLRALPDADRAYVEAAVREECDFVRNGKHKNSDGRNNALNAAAFALGQLVAGGVLDRAEAEGELIQAAIDSGLDRDPNCGERGIRATVTSGLEAGMKEPRGVPDDGRTGEHETATAPSSGWGVYVGGTAVAEGTDSDLASLGIRRPKAVYQKYELLTLGEILSLEIPDPNWAIPGILAEGLNMLVGSPKMGKSMLALNLALTVAGGGKALGNIQTVPGDVLYLSLEDQVRRIQNRARRMVRKLGDDARNRLRVVTKWPTMDRGGLALLEHWVKAVSSPRLLVIDVLGKFRPAIREKGNQYEQDSRHLYPVKEFADDHGFTALVVHHTRKSATGKEGGDRDEFEEISGTQGLAGACDGIVLLRRSRRSNEAVISITGRDESEQRLALQFDPDTLTWTSLGTAEEHLAGKFQQKVLELFKDHRGKPLFVSEIAARLKADDSAVRATLYRLEEKFLVGRRGNAWVYPGDHGADTEGF
jgi:hypothetical protein